MRKVLVMFSLLLFACSASLSQASIKPRNYPSLFWEISGNGLKKPSYLFGTMHVSNKMAFFLSDSFYIAIKNADVVALETNPESWQDDMDRYVMDGYGVNGRGSGRGSGDYTLPADYLTLHSFRIGRYEKKLEAALYLQPSVINNLLYRSYSSYTNDFEEDTYLDLYIYQLGKKSGKKVTGVEQYQESMRLMLEAYRDASKEKNRKVMSYDIADELRQENLQEAYRSGNLDWLDSINRVNSESAAFDEKFIFRRNEIQARSIDSILKHSRLFVGVGAAHLPGDRGVIELLRRKGYRLRPVMMRNRDDKEKDKIEKIRVAVNFQAHVSDDGFYSVRVPGKLFDSGEGSQINQQQYADMANGSYYMVTRVKTENLYWRHDETTVLKKIDSVLYENVPGKILHKKYIQKNGYKGLDITNRTRRGDVQRYNIFVTPFEVIVFKISGTGEYVLEGSEADEFLNSISLKEYQYGKWQDWHPSTGGFNVQLPHTPYVSIGRNNVYEALDKTGGTHFLIIRRDVANFGFAEEDTFDLALSEESFASSAFIDKQLERKQGRYGGYPSLDCRYLNKDGSLLKVRYLIQGPHYYILAAHAEKENPLFDKFFSSFTISPFVYHERRDYTDTVMHFTVSTTWFPEQQKEKIELPENYGEGEGEEDFSYLSTGEFSSRTLVNDSTGEKIFVSYFRSPKYYYEKDSSVMNRIIGPGVDDDDSTWIIRKTEKSYLENNIMVNYRELTGTNSSRVIRVKSFYRKGVGYVLMNEGDTLTPPGTFVQNFFDSFRPTGEMEGFDPLEKKSGVFFADYFSRDTVTRKKAAAALTVMEFDTGDISSLKTAIERLNWRDQEYLRLKKSFIQKFSRIRTPESADYLRHLYQAAGDTTELQYTILETLLHQKTIYAYSLFSEMITADPPVLGINDFSGNFSNRLRGYSGRRYRQNDDEFYNGRFLDELTDSLQLTKKILPGLLPLVNLDDYEFAVMHLLARLVDSNLLGKKEYKTYFSKFLIEAKHALKKQAAREMKRSIEQASRDEEEEEDDYRYEKDKGNEQLALYTGLLIPYSRSHPEVKNLFGKLLASGDKKLKYDITLLLTRHDLRVPDSLFLQLAADEEYRYNLYMDLLKLQKPRLFPASFNTQELLAKSSLLNTVSYNTPDSVCYLEKIRTTCKDREGYIYFFKYKQRRDDPGWKLASVGLAPLDQKKFIFDEDLESLLEGYYDGFGSDSFYDRYDFTEFSDTRLKEEVPLETQLNELVKRMKYVKRKSARMFYNEQYGGYDMLESVSVDSIRD